MSDDGNETGNTEAVVPAERRGRSQAEPGGVRTGPVGGIGPGDTLDGGPAASGIPEDVTTMPDDSSSHAGFGEVLGIVAVGMTAGDAEDALADQVRERMPNLLRRALVAQAPGERLDQPVHTLGRLEQDRPTVGACLLLVELGHQRLVEQIREQNTLWYSVGRHAGASVVVKTLGNTPFLPYGGSCVSTWFGSLGA